MKKSLKRDRIKACELAAQVMAGDPEMPKLWSVTVFFECYIQKGAAGTAVEFGPPDPVELKVIKDDQHRRS